MRNFTSLQKFGIALSIIWFVGFGVYLLAHRYGEAHRIQEVALNDCKVKYDNILDAINLSPNEKQRRAIDTERTECSKAVAAEFLKNGGAIEREAPLLAAIDFGTVIFAWLIAWMFLQFTFDSRGRPH